MFRTEASPHKADRLHGNVAIFVPVAWQGIGYLMAASVLIAIIFLAFAPYSRSETVAGEIAPASGVALIVPTRAGVLTDIAVTDGQHVAAGTTLAIVRAEEDTVSGRSTAAQIEAAIGRQDSSLVAQSAATSVAAGAQLDQLAAQRAGLAAEVSQLGSQIDLQKDLVESARRDLERARAVAVRGFISGHDLQIREEALVSRKQGLSQLVQTAASKRSALVEAQRTAAQVSAQARAQTANLAATRAQVAQEAANTRGARSYALRATIAGRVTALTARPGQPATPQAPLMTIVPDGAELRAILSAPTSSIGFLQRGQAVHLAIDAFPYQRFGTVGGRVLTVAGSTVNRTGANGSVVPVYPVTVALDRAALSAFGRPAPLVSGMTLTARIVIERQTLLQWLFAPVYAVRKR